MLAFGFRPLVPYPGRNKRWRCVCVTCASERLRTFGGPGCRNCDNVARRVTDADAVVGMEYFGLLPVEPFPGTQLPSRVRCALCGAESRPRLTNVVNPKFRSCQHCSPPRPRVEPPPFVARRRTTDPTTSPADEPL
jgi:hypothetical protein